jgi:hypothetical protein
MGCFSLRLWGIPRNVPSTDVFLHHLLLSQKVAGLIPATQKVVMII